ncbi:MAG: hypothetical protein U5K54_16445 [Cytophagales bacterium]|nr:hypothetical protein [Cytophagales bacterium]
MNSELATPDDLKEAVAFPNAGVHVIGCSMTSKDVEGVYAAMKKFAVEKLGIKAIQYISLNQQGHDLNSNPSLGVVQQHV